MNIGLIRVSSIGQKDNTSLSNHCCGGGAGVGANDGPSSSQLPSPHRWGAKRWAETVRYRRSPSALISGKYSGHTNRKLTGSRLKMARQPANPN